MASRSVRLDLNISKEYRSDIKPIVLGQGDGKGLRLEVNVYTTDYNRGNVSYSMDNKSVCFCMRLPNSNKYVRDSTGYKSGSLSFAYEVDESVAASVPGHTEAYFQITDSATGEVVSTERFPVDILRSAMDGAKPAESWDSEINELIRRAEEAVAAAEDVVELKVPVMSSFVRGGAKLGSGLRITDSDVLGVYIADTSLDDAVAAAFAS